MKVVAKTNCGPGVGRRFALGAPVQGSTFQVQSGNACTFASIVPFCSTEKIRNEPMRSARQFKLPGSMFKVFSKKYETNPFRLFVPLVPLWFNEKITRR